MTTAHAGYFTDCFEFCYHCFLPPDNQRPSVQQQQSPELVVFQEKRLILHTGILNNIQDIARRAFARSLIPGGVSRIITDTLNHLTADERTDQLLKELESRVKIDPAVLMKFVDVLRDSDAACYSTLITTISKFCAVACSLISLDAAGFQSLL